MHWQCTLNVHFIGYINGVNAGRSASLLKTRSPKSDAVTFRANVSCTAGALCWRILQFLYTAIAPLVNFPAEQGAPSRTYCPSSDGCTFWSHCTVGFVSIKEHNFPSSAPITVLSCHSFFLFHFLHQRWLGVFDRLLTLEVSQVNIVTISYCITW